VAYFKVLSRYSHRGTEKCTKNLFKADGVQSSFETGTTECNAELSPLAEAARPVVTIVI
jgi:hypothetical protein